MLINHAGKHEPRMLMEGATGRSCTRPRNVTSGTVSPPAQRLLLGRQWPRNLGFTLVLIPASSQRAVEGDQCEKLVATSTRQIVLRGKQLLLGVQYLEI